MFPFNVGELRLRKRVDLSEARCVHNQYFQGGLFLKSVYFLPHVGQVLRKLRDEEKYVSKWFVYKLFS